ncbi:hypothetical protein ACFFSY_09880 [Paenibacillus aurantiacus]|uniref:Uncharacterized protein n=1 Tax=Paenibacillus aurantiacus TaxID=1936118 RepID=A0ABV5KMS3_9BACL
MSREAPLPGAEIDVRSELHRQLVDSRAGAAYPAMKELIAENLPEAKLAITKYNFGNGDGISAGIAQAEAQAIFGREGVDLDRNRASARSAMPRLALAASCP